MRKKWKGSYKYNKRKLQQVIGFEQTYFDIEINSIEGNDFTGKVIDDIITGGTSGVGEVIGRISGDRIAFVKKMPVLMVISNGKMIPADKKKHNDIFYSGALSADAKSASGEWRFKLGAGFLDLFPAIHANFWYLDNECR